MKLTEKQGRRLAERLKIVSNGCWEWQGHTVKGYGRMKVNGKSWSLHRLVFALYHGAAPSGKMMLRHLCHNRKCANIDHLAPGTSKQNVQDTISVGRNACGEKNGSAKLTSSQVEEIRTRYVNGERPKELALEYGVGRSHIYKIHHRELWKNG